MINRRDIRREAGWLKKTCFYWQRQRVEPRAESLEIHEALEGRASNLRLVASIAACTTTVSRFWHAEQFVEGVVAAKPRQLIRAEKTEG